MALAGDAVCTGWPAPGRGWRVWSTPAVLAGAGVFQLSPLRRRLLTAARESRASSWRHAMCVSAVAAPLMLVVFALGVGNLLGMAVLTAVMTVERATNPRLERLSGRPVGWALIAAGALVAIQPGLIG